MKYASSLQKFAAPLLVVAVFSVLSLIFIPEFGLPAMQSETVVVEPNDHVAATPSCVLTEASSETSEVYFAGCGGVI